MEPPWPHWLAWLTLKPPSEFHRLGTSGNSTTYSTTQNVYSESLYYATGLDRSIRFQFAKHHRYRLFEDQRKSSPYTQP